MTAYFKKLTPARLIVQAVWILVLTVACVAFSAQTVHGASDFIIEDYDIDMQVNEDDTYLITETLDVHFTAPSHGIYRVIPYRTRLDRDGQLSTFFGKVSDFEMLSGQPYEKDKGDEAYFFKIGDPDQYAETDTTYKYSYVFDMRGDHLRGADEVYYNLVGTAWEARDIKHVSFTVTFPKDIDMNNVGVKTGNQVSVPFEADGNRIVKGDTTETVLGGLTIRAVLPDGYFTKQARSSNLLFLILIAILAAAAVMGFFLWRRYGKDPAIVETEEFYPPKGMSAPEVSFLDTGDLTRDHVTSLLLTLADKGYLQIVEKEETYGRKKQKTRTTYELVKLKEYDGKSGDERTFLKGLFKDGGDTVQVEDLEDSFYEVIDDIIEDIKTRYDGELWDETAKHFAGLLRVAGFLGMVALFVISKILNGSPFIVGNGDFFVYCAFAFLEVALPVAGFYGIAKWINKPKKSVFGFLIGFVGWAFNVLIGFGLAALFDTCIGAQIPLYLIGMGAIFILFLLAALCERMTDEYAELLGKIRGYKRFLQIAEKERIEMLAEQDPDYYYKTLAFAFALGVTTVFAERFAALAKEAPVWYSSPYYSHDSDGFFNTESLMDSMDSMMSSVSSSMTSSPSSSGGGGSFSGGGGAGGGGGGSW